MDRHAALYARVSSEQQATAHTIASQLAALHERVAADGLRLRDDLSFIDEGYSGATLIRPALEGLRDAAAAGEVDRLYVHSPDRLARKYAYQALLLDGFCCRKMGKAASPYPQGVKGVDSGVCTMRQRDDTARRADATRRATLALPALSAALHGPLDERLLAPQSAR